MTSGRESTGKGAFGSIIKAQTSVNAVMGSLAM